MRNTNERVFEWVGGFPFDGSALRYCALSVRYHLGSCITGLKNFDVTGNPCYSMIPPTNTNSTNSFKR